MTTSHFTISPEDLHTEALAKWEDAPWVVVLALTALFVEGHAVNTLVNNDISVVQLMLLHILITTMLGIFCLLMARQDKDTRFPFLLLITTATMGPFGAIGTLLSLAFHIFYLRYALPFTEWFTSIFPPARRTLPMTIEENLLTGRDASPRAYSILPFTDVMRYGSEQQKRSAIMKMSQYFQPPFASALQMGLADESNAIRVQAATAIARIENNFMYETLALEAEQKKRKDNPSHIRRLARHYDDYAFTGLLDPDREQRNRRRALEWYRQYLEYYPDDADANLAVARLYLRMGDVHDAAAWCEAALGRGVATPELASWYMECLYLLKRYQELRAFAQSHPLPRDNEVRFPHVMHEVVDLWKIHPNTPVAMELKA